MLNPTPIEQEGPNPFDAFDTLGEILGFVWHDKGEPALRQLLDMHRNNPKPSDTREIWLDAANELCEAGMYAVADIIHDLAQEFPSAKPKNEYPKGSKRWAMVEAKWRRSYSFPALNAHLAKRAKKPKKH